MKAGICPGCRRWRIAIRLPKCPHLGGHAVRVCPAPRFTDWFCREHECGPRRPALHVTDIDRIPRRQTVTTGSTL